MKSVLLSKQPQIVANVLNENSKLLVCKKFPKDFVGWVYIYCTMGKPYLYHEKTNLYGDDIYELTNDSTSDLPNRKHAYTVGNELNGKVVARFWCDKVERFYNAGQWVDEEPDDIMNTICNYACISRDDLDDYCEGEYFYTIHISKLEVFDRPRELSDFHKIVNIRKCDTRYCDDYYTCNKCAHSKLTKAPQNYCYIESEE